jgi:hypothetical protein
MYELLRELQATEKTPEYKGQEGVKADYTIL